ncbi:MAG: hypothetical protein CFE44_16935, partial [Burkholderiales bacterium PBB4]
MIRFTIFGVPVEIQPMFWLTGAFIGGAINARTKEQILGVLVFMIVEAISILVHELGHALVGRRLGGGSQHHPLGPRRAGLQSRRPLHPLG